MASKRRRRGGRPRKNRARHSNGHLKPVASASPRQTAEAMPHRRGLGDDVLDQRAATTLGRLVLAGELSAEQGQAGERYAELWRRYAATLDGPRWPWGGQGRVSVCSGCPTPAEQENCTCAFLARSWERCRHALWSAGYGAGHLVRLVAIEGLECARTCLGLLRAGLSALAQVFGLTNHHNRMYAETHNPAVV